MKNTRLHYIMIIFLNQKHGQIPVVLKVDPEIVNCSNNQVEYSASDIVSIAFAYFESTIH